MLHFRLDRVMGNTCDVQVPARQHRQKLVVVHVYTKAEVNQNGQSLSR